MVPRTNLCPRRPNPARRTDQGRPYPGRHTQAPLPRPSHPWSSHHSAPHVSSLTGSGQGQYLPYVVNELLGASLEISPSYMQYRPARSRETISPLSIPIPRVTARMMLVTVRLDHNSKSGYAKSTRATKRPASRISYWEIGSGTWAACSNPEALSRARFRGSQRVRIATRSAF